MRYAPMCNAVPSTTQHVDKMQPKHICVHFLGRLIKVFFSQVTGQCVCPAGNICCDPDAMEAKRAKEMHIRKLRTENKDLSAMLTESQSMLEEAQRRRLR